MQQLTCSVSADCSFMFNCQNHQCVHNPIFPLSAYTISVYAFAGVASALCNIAGASMGIFKMLILIILLGYELDQATGLAQALVVGTALPNFLSIILKKHPTLPTSLVNYKLLAVLIPCCLLGSTVGALAQTLIPKIGQIILLVIVFMYFAFSFINKLRAISKKFEQTKQSLIQTQKSIVTSFPQQVAYNNQNSQKLQILNYQKTYHIPQIMFSIAVFLVFQCLSFLVQGKFPFYTIEKCSKQFCVGLVTVLIITLVYLFFVFREMKNIYAKYRKYQIIQEIYLDQYQEFLKISAGAFAAGTIQGLLGMGCGTCIVILLLSYPIASTSASATSGYQILFTGMASLLEYYLNGEVQIFQSVWFLGICLVIGGFATIILYKIMEKMNALYVNRFLLSILIGLCLMSVGLTVPTVTGILNKEGWSGLTSIAFKC